MTTCIRRPRTTWTTCPCPPCDEDRRRLTKLARNGLYSRIPSEAGWAVIDALRARGWTGQAIASAANLPRYTIERAITSDQQGKRRRFSPQTTAALVSMGDPTSGGVGSHGARRRLQGLARQGYDLQTVAAATGIGFSTLASIRNGGSGGFVKARFHVAIRDYAESVGMRLGPSELAIKHAARKEWPSLLAWDDIDNPRERAKTAVDRDRKTYIDHAAVERRYNGDKTVRLTPDEAAEVCRRAYRAGRSTNWIEEHVGLKAERYFKVGEDAA